MFAKKDLIYAVYKEKSFSKAAESLFISQPSLSAMIKKVESKVGEPIFDRSTNPIQLTEIGKKYIACCEAIAKTEDTFANYLNDTYELKTGSLALGSNHLFMANVLPKFIEIFVGRYPYIDLNLVDSHSHDLEKKLLDGELDLIIDNKELNPSIYEKFFLGTEFLLLAVPRKLEINQGLEKYQLSYKDILKNRHIDDDQVLSTPLSFFAHTPFVLMPEGNDTRTRTNNIFLRQSIKPNLLFQLNQLATVYTIISIGLGSSFISDTLIKQSPAMQTQLVFYKVDDPDTKRKVFFHAKKNRYMTKAMEEFIAISKKYSPLSSLTE
ncbi:LysR family transcriptional regulator [Aminipila butyrica]|uniref:LysR family transcriptional regulator n=1 Tax=Aminipila butyrica TaxID=433296 RepID=A0A858BY31_9FIRM|nr:LysR family transcriptional regulator [Aminipila butyrica]QIB69820.1 LysR family transcriptional regulator [Aminipila butyrica]